MIKYNNKITIYKTISISVVILLSIILLFYNINIKNSPSKNLDNDQNTKVSIKDSILEGADKKGKTYVITSKSVAKKEDDLYHLIVLSGIYNLGKLGLEIVASKGIMNDQNKILFLNEDIKIDYGDYKATTEKLEVNLDDMSAKNNDGVEILYQHSHTHADAFELDTNDSTMHLHGNVKTYINLSDFNR